MEDIHCEHTKVQPQEEGLRVGRAGQQKPNATQEQRAASSTETGYGASSFLMGSIKMAAGKQRQGVEREA
jgi:hypothetical protein